MPEKTINLKKNCRNILVPYYIWGAIGVLAEVSIMILQHTFSTELLWNIVLKYVFGIEMWNYPLWFLPAFFVGKTVYQAIQKSCVKKTSSVVETIAVFLCGSVGIYLASIRISFYPFRFDTG